MRLMILVTALAACAGGDSEEKFREDQARITCERKELCPDAATGADCSVAEPPAVSEIFVCTFDSEAADVCLEALELAECQGSGIEFPVECGQVFIDCEDA